MIYNLIKTVYKENARQHASDAFLALTAGATGRKRGEAPGIEDFLELEKYLKKLKETSTKDKKKDNNDNMFQ